MNDEIEQILQSLQGTLNDIEDSMRDPELEGSALVKIESMVDQLYDLKEAYMENQQ